MFRYFLTLSTSGKVPMPADTGVGVTRVDVPSTLTVGTTTGAVISSSASPGCWYILAVAPSGLLENKVVCDNLHDGAMT